MIKKWLSFAFEQILGNSVKYSSAGGEITIETYENKLVIEDNGIGIKEEDLPRIFEKGLQVLMEDTKKNRVV